MSKVVKPSAPDARSLTRHLGSTREDIGMSDLRNFLGVKLVFDGC